jgi:hypothetical protein
MTMTRLSPGPRMSEAVTIGDIVFLAGQVPDDLTADHGTDPASPRQHRRGACATWWHKGRHCLGSGLAGRHGRFCRHERSVGCPG